MSTDSQQFNKAIEMIPTDDPVLNRIINEMQQSYAIRKQIIREIEDEMNVNLVVYLSNPTHPFAIISRQDVVPLEDILRSLPKNDKPVALLINSPGGDPNAAEKILIMFRSRFKEFYVIIPDYAKSAATMIALGSDKIYMGYLSELGPIDPQIEVTMPNGKKEIIPARAFIDSLKYIKQRVSKKEDPIEIYMPMLANLRPELIDICQKSLDDAEAFAVKWLKSYMLKNNPDQAEKIAEELTRGDRYKSHGKVIDFKEAKEYLNLNVEYLKPESPLWNKIWELYVRGTQFLQVTNQVKLYENNNISLALQVSVQKIQSR